MFRNDKRKVRGDTSHVKGSESRQFLHSGWVIANHVLVSFHVAFISSVLVLPAVVLSKGAVLTTIFGSSETLISAAFWYITFHMGIALHEMGHYLKAVKLNALKEDLLPLSKKKMKQSFFKRFSWYVSMFLRIPWGKFRGVKKESLTYYPEAPYNLAVAAEGSKVSKRLASVALPVAILLLVVGLLGNYNLSIYGGRLALGIGIVGLLDYFLADPGKYKEFKEREARAAEKAEKVTIAEEWLSKAGKQKEMMVKNRMQEIILPLEGKSRVAEKLKAPWQFRNCGMGGVHTTKEYPESNISMQEMMFIPLCTKDYEEAQRITVELQTRLKQIIEKTEGARVMGIGFEGGLAPYIAKEEGDVVPEQRLWRMAVQTIKECGYKPGEDVAIAFDPALSQLSIAYRKEFGQPDAIGMYFFWKSEEKVVMTRDEILGLFKKAVGEGIPIISIEDGFAEDDYEGWKLLMKEFGKNILIVGDDLITTKDSSIEKAIDENLINTILIKPNQIGTLSETLLAMLVGLGKGCELVVSHRSKSPNDDMEAQFSLAANTMGLKAGGGANTERLFKYGAVMKIMKDMGRAVEEKGMDVTDVKKLIDKLVVTDITAYEEATNAGIPTVGIEVHAGLEGSKEFRKILKFTGSTPLGTSAGVGEAIHLIDSIIEKSPLVEKHKDLFEPRFDKTYHFREGVGKKDVIGKKDEELLALWEKAQRYEGQGCRNAVENVKNIIAKIFLGKKISELGDISEIDRKLLSLEREIAIHREKISPDADLEAQIEVMQKKANLGMNAILSVSLALGRLIAHVQGKELWQVLREKMKETMAKTIASIRDEKVLKMLEEKMPADDIERIKTKAARKGKELWELLKEQMSFDDLVVNLQMAGEKFKSEGKKLYELLREQMLIYPTISE